MRRRDENEVGEQEDVAVQSKHKRAPFSFPDLHGGHLVLEAV